MEKVAYTIYQLPEDTYTLAELLTFLVERYESYGATEDSIIIQQGAGILSQVKAQDRKNGRVVQSRNGWARRPRSLRMRLGRLIGN